MKKYILYILIVFFFLGCEEKKEIKLAVNSWIGYVPLFYANEKGWLQKSGIKLIKTNSLGESVSLYKNGFVDGLASTQYEYLQISTKVKPIILLDKSFGGDMILSNKSIDKLVVSKDITAYLEIGSVNFLLLNYFLKSHNISMNNINLISSNQKQLVQMLSDYNNDIIVVTYSPYDVNFKKLGFKVVASTKTDKNLLIIDALFIDKKFDSKKFISLKKYVDIAIKEIQTNPKSVFKVIRSYYPNYTYNEFKKALKNIKWINNPDRELLEELKNINFPIEYLIK